MPTPADDNITIDGSTSSNAVLVDNFTFGSVGSGIKTEDMKSKKWSDKHNPIMEHLNYERIKLDINYGESYISIHKDDQCGSLGIDFDDLDNLIELLESVREKLK